MLSKLKIDDIKHQVERLSAIIFERERKQAINLKHEKLSGKL